MSTKSTQHCPKLKRIYWTDWTPFKNQGSGWILNQITSFTVKTATLDEIGAGSYIPLPKFLAVKKAIINIKNEDEKCFLYCILAHSHPAKAHKERVSKYKDHLQELNTEEITTPVTLDQIDIFEDRNLAYSVNVLTYSPDDPERVIYPVRVSKFRGRPHHVNLFLLAGWKNTGEYYFHYCLIENLSRLLTHVSKHRGSPHVCKYCLHRFEKETNLKKHIKTCSIYPVRRLTFPGGKSVIDYDQNLDYWTLLEWNWSC